MPKILRHAKLYFREGTSDKVYNITLTEEVGVTSIFKHRVMAEWGRRNWPKLNITWKTGDNLASFTEATRIFEETMREKINKGYVLASQEATTNDGTKFSSSKKGEVTSTPPTQQEVNDRIDALLGAPPKPKPQINLNPQRLIELD